MFSSKAKAAASAAEAHAFASKGHADRPAPPSIISKDLTITGDLISEGDIQVDGVIEGDLRSRSLTVGETAEITGSVEAETARVHGCIKGQIKASVVELMRDAKMIGDIIHGTLSIEAGAHVEGSLTRIASDPKAIAPPEQTLSAVETGATNGSKAPAPRSAEKKGASEAPEAAVAAEFVNVAAAKSASGDDVIDDDVPNPLSKKIKGTLG